jgi:hypothetical protein
MNDSTTVKVEQGAAYLADNESDMRFAQPLFVVATQQVTDRPVFRVFHHYPEVAIAER